MGLLDISMASNSELYFDYRKSIDYCSKIKPTVEVQSTNFFCFWRGDFALKEELTIKYFLHSNPSHQLFFFTPTDISSNSLLKPYLDKIVYRVYDPLSLAKGSILEDRRDILLSTDRRGYLESDLFRILVLYVYGGVYFDMDTLILRDFSPLLEGDNFAFQWGQTMSVTNTILFISKKNNTLINFLFDQILSNRKVGNSTCWGTDIFTKAYHYDLIKVYPCSWFDTFWAIPDYTLNKDPELKLFCQTPFKKTKYSNWLFEGTFAQHYHNSQSKEQIEEGSWFWNMMKKVDNL